MSNFIRFRHKSNGLIVSYPAHYKNHPVLGPDLEVYEPGAEYEEDKVVIETDHNVPVEQRASIVATEKQATTPTKKDKN